MSQDQEFWGGSDIVYYCLIDRKRTETYRNSIFKSVKKGDVVADLGSGTGIFAHFAISAGAKRVYVVEADKNLFTILKKTFGEKKYKNKIVLINDDASRIKFSEKLDVIICEMIATGLIDEFQVPVMNHAIQYKKRDTRVIPASINNYVDVVYNKDTFYGYRLPIVRYEYHEHVDCRASRTQPYSKKIMYKQIDFSRKNNKNLDVCIPIEMTKSGTINGVRISNQTIFPDGTKLGGTLGYCMPLILPLATTKIRKGNRFTLKLSYELCRGLENLSYQLNRIT